MRLVVAPLQYWGEENHADARYNIYLRKVQYRQPVVGAMVNTWTNAFPEDNANGQLDGEERLQWETVREATIKAGSVSRLVGALIDENGCLDGKHFNIFFNTYRTFSSPSEVLQLLLGIFRDGSEDHPGLKQASGIHRIRLTIRSVINTWMTLFPEDFEDEGSSGTSPIEAVLDFSAQNMEYFAETYEKASRMYSSIKRDPHGLVGRRWLHAKHGLAPSYNSLDCASPSGCIDKSIDFINMNERYIAEQLTYCDADLLKVLVPYQCLAKFWNNRRKYKFPSHDRVYSVRATVNQFNDISTRVISIILDPGGEQKSLAARAKIIAKWIDVLRELRSLRNYSSVRAVLSSLQCEPVHRLRSVWTHVSKTKIKYFDEISQNYSADENSLGGQLPAEKAVDSYVGGCATSQESVPARRNRPYYRAKSDILETQGAVPYLGAFLTDLIHIDAACPETTNDGLVNFEKKRKEFQVLAQIKMFQSAAKAYHIVADPKFRSWFAQLPNYPESKWMELSQAVQPENHLASKKKHSLSFGSLASLTHLVSELIPNGSALDNSCESLEQSSQDVSAYNGFNDLSSSPCSITVTPPCDIHQEKMPSWNSGAGSPFGLYHISPIPGSQYGSEFDVSAFVDWVKRKQKPRSLQHRRQRWHSTRSCGSESVYSARTAPTISPRGSDDSDSPGYGDGNNTFSARSTLSLCAGSPSSAGLAGRSIMESNYRKKSLSTESSFSTPISQSSSFDEATRSDCLLVRVSLAAEVQPESPFLSSYKCIRVESRDKSETLIMNALARHKICGNPSDYALVQLLPDGKQLTLPPRANAFYALNQSLGGRKIHCTLKKKTEESVPTNQKELRERKVSLPVRLLRWHSTQ